MQNSKCQKYKGSELELFGQAVNWKLYYYTRIKKYLAGRVLEVGAGIGETTRHLCGTAMAQGIVQDQWVCLEPDAEQLQIIKDKIERGELPENCICQLGFINELADDDKFNSIIYIDVLEHIEDDKNELEQAGRHLIKGGYLLVLSPAHNWLYSAFDKEIGHYRRYTKKMLRALIPDGMQIVRMEYLDSAGLLASMGNKLLLKAKMPTKKQIAFWDKFLVRISKVLDVLVFFQVGKSILMVLKKD